MEAEQRYVIRFFSDEGMPGVQIVERLRQHYGENAFFGTQVYFGINEVKRGRTDLNTIASPGREPDESLTAVITGKLDTDPHFGARKLAQSLGVAVSTICRYLTEVLGMKLRHVHLVPHTLTPAQKLMRAELAQSMLQALAKHEHTNYRFPFTGDESWMFYADDHRTRWVASWDDVDEIERRSHFHQNTMLFMTRSPPNDPFFDTLYDCMRILLSARKGLRLFRGWLEMGSVFGNHRKDSCKGAIRLASTAPQRRASKLQCLMRNIALSQGQSRDRAVEPPVRRS